MCGVTPLSGLEVVNQITNSVQIVKQRLEVKAMSNRFDELAKQLQESLGLMEAAYLENPDKFLADALKFEEESAGGIMLDELLPCPACGNEVEWTNSRDIDILTSRIACTCCELSCFHVDTRAFVTLLNLDYETTRLKYNTWCLTSPKYYGDYSWE